MRYYGHGQHKFDHEHKQRQQAIEQFPFWLLVLLPVVLLCLVALMARG